MKTWKTWGRKENLEGKPGENLGTDEENLGTEENLEKENLGKTWGRKPGKTWGKPGDRRDVPQFSKS
jgi:hypothetical protein